MGKNHPKNQSEDKTFILALCGKDYSDSDVDADVAGNILINFSQLLSLTNDCVSSSSRVDLKLKANNEGSFEFLFSIYEIVQNADQILLPGTGVSLSTLITTTLGIVDVGVGLIEVLKFLKGKEPQKVITNHNSVTIIGDNNKHINITHNTYNLFSNPEAREALAKITSQLSGKSSDSSIEFRNPQTKNPMQRISQEELPYFQYEKKEELIEEPFERVVVKIIKAVFVGEASWRIKHDGYSFEAKFLDKAWLKSYQNREVLLPPNSSLRVTLLKKTPINTSKINTPSKYEILKVHEVINPEEQTNFKID